MPVEIRPIRPSDDPALRDVIRTVMPEFGAAGPGFAIHDAEVDAMYEAYSAPRSRYFVLDDAGRVLGGGGLGPLAGAPEVVCEVRKMYLLPEARGRGLGALLFQRILDEAPRLGFSEIYLETLKTMTQARKLYESRGFTRIDKPMGATGHFGCDAWYHKKLT